MPVASFVLLGEGAVRSFEYALSLPSSPMSAEAIVVGVKGRERARKLIIVWGNGERIPVSNISDFGKWLELL